MKEKQEVKLTCPVCNGTGKATHILHPSKIEISRAAYNLHVQGYSLRKIVEILKLKPGAQNAKHYIEQYKKYESSRKDHGLDEGSDREHK